MSKKRKPIGYIILSDILSLVFVRVKPLLLPE